MTRIPTIFRPRQLYAMAAAVTLSACCLTRPPVGRRDEPVASLRLLTFARDEADVKAWVSAMGGPEALNQLRMKSMSCGDREALIVTIDRGFGGYVEDALIFRRIKEGWELVAFWEGRGSTEPLRIEDDRGTLVLWLGGVPMLRVPKDSL